MYLGELSAYGRVNVQCLCVLKQKVKDKKIPKYFFVKPKRFGLGLSSVARINCFEVARKQGVRYSSVVFSNVLLLAKKCARMLANARKKHSIPLNSVSAQ